MELNKILTRDMISVDLGGETKDEVINSLIGLLIAGGKVSDRDKIKAAVMDRELKMSTGMENGVAIPHGKSDAVEELVGCLGIKKDGVDFDSFDGSPGRIFVLTVSPVHGAEQHIQFLSEISSLLRDPFERQRLLDAESSDEIYSILCE